ncbi:hypothetical protein CH63R_14637 [Colletotrichum higginsianum IMI 349063]|uniref:Uncharacterized protein n=1 Tax=Colletotrichum higginsianum (strain IMI 349063) TaxID=759273 RepID=A0A1B7XQM4_COLHI|nr:hypothetical protein CH63R_14637 [Colletotrichum higginsianum IMI 349063]OBR02065.1 hypothetical protein CH63R_14637 [Colletotrichum higginsianum IMI 349063]
MESHYTLPRRDFDTDQVYFDTLLEYGMAIQNCELQLRHAFNSHCHAVNDAPLSDLSDLTSLPSRASRLPQHLVLAKAKQLAPIFFEYEAEQAAQARQQHTVPRPSPAASLPPAVSSAPSTLAGPTAPQWKRPPPSPSSLQTPPQARGPPFSTPFEWSISNPFRPSTTTPPQLFGPALPTPSREGSHKIPRRGQRPPAPATTPLPPFVPPKSRNNTSKTCRPAGVP